MRSKLSPLSGFVHMKGHLLCRGHHASSLAVYKLVSRCVCVREYEEDDTDLQRSHLTSCVSLLELEGTELEKEVETRKDAEGFKTVSTPL